MTVPPFHTTNIRTEFLCSASLSLQHRFSAGHTPRRPGNFRVPADMRTHGIWRKMESERDISRADALQTQIIHCDFFLWFHKYLHKRGRAVKTALPKKLLPSLLNGSDLQCLDRLRQHQLCIHALMRQEAHLAVVGIAFAQALDGTLTSVADPEKAEVTE